MIGITIPKATLGGLDFEPEDEDYWPAITDTSRPFMWFELLITSAKVPICLC